MCKAHQDDLYKVDAALHELTKSHPAASQIKFLDTRERLENLPPGMVYADDRHPCWVRPCSWDKGCQDALRTEQNAIQQSYEIGFGVYETHSEWYAREMLRYHEYKEAIEKDAAEWHITSAKAAFLNAYPVKNGTDVSPTTSPLGIMERVGIAQAMLGDLIGEQKLLAMQALAVQQIQIFAPKPYSNNEGMCPELLKSWSELLTGRIGVSFEMRKAEVVEPTGELGKVKAPEEPSKPRKVPQPKLRAFAKANERALDRAVASAEATAPTAEAVTSRNRKPLSPPPMLLGALGRTASFAPLGEAVPDEWAGIARTILDANAAAFPPVPVPPPPPQPLRGGIWG